MDKDFHYYATYVAANAVGYSVSEATTIAHAAQYVDASSKVMLLPKEKLGFQPVPTIHTNGELGWGEIGIGLTEADLRQVWPVFHFLPGNYKSKVHPDEDAKDRIQSYTGPKSHSGWFSGWKYDKRAEWEFSLMCLPFSPMSTAMINDTTTKHKGKPYELQMIGLRMHVLADTFAHMFYAGTPAWHVNDVAGDVMYATPDGMKKIPFGPLSEWCTPVTPGYHSYVYHGHGRMGHVPDYPWVDHEYHPIWSSGNVYKANKKYFLYGFLEMLRALASIRAGRPYIPRAGEIDEELARIAANVMKKDHPWGENLRNKCE